jgi:sigma-B regulation protein RsbU (phosphoserine phosphatase)
MTDKIQPRESLERRRGERRTGDRAVASLLEAARGLTAAEDLQSGLATVAETLRRDIGWDTFGVLLLDDLGRELSFAFALGFSEAVARHWRFGLGQGIVGAAAAEGRSILVADVAQDERYLRADQETHSELAVPLKIKERVVGVVDLASREPGYYTVEDQTALELLSDHLAGAIEAQRLYANVRSQAQTLSVLHELSRELTAIHDRKRVLERVADRLRSLIRFDVFTVLLWNETERALDPWVSVRRDHVTSDGREPMPLGVGISGTAAALRQTIRVPNVTVDPRFVSCNPDLPVRSEIAVPLLFEDRLIGVLDLESLSYDAFGLEHEQLLGTLGSSLAIALSNAELYEDLEESRGQLDEDLRTARELQRRLLPRSTPWVGGLQIAVESEPARHLGGDFYDFFQPDEGHFAVALGDVAGKSTSAALYGALAVGMLRELVGSAGAVPEKVLARLNRRLRTLQIPNRFLARAFALYDRESGRIRLANSGLPYPYLLQGRHLEEVVVAGVPLGLFDQQRYEAVELALDPGEALVVASDGLVEARDDRDREFGPERMADTLRRLADRSAQGIAGGVLEAVARFTETAEPSDDRTIVVIKRCVDATEA